jgi:hypothetical protein
VLHNAEGSRHPAVQQQDQGAQHLQCTAAAPARHWLLGHRLLLLLAGVQLPYCLWDDALLPLLQHHVYFAGQPAALLAAASLAHCQHAPVCT